jgi:hypothetical protein
MVATIAVFVLGSIGIASGQDNPMTPRKDHDPRLPYAAKAVKTEAMLAS